MALPAVYFLDCSVCTESAMQLAAAFVNMCFCSVQCLLISSSALPQLSVQSDSVSTVQKKI